MGAAHLPALVEDVLRHGTCLGLSQTEMRLRYPISIKLKIVDFFYPSVLWIISSLPSICSPIPGNNQMLKRVITKTLLPFTLRPNNLGDTLSLRLKRLFRLFDAVSARLKPLCLNPNKGMRKRSRKSLEKYLTRASSSLWVDCHFPHRWRSQTSKQSGIRMMFQVLDTAEPF